MTKTRGMVEPEEWKQRRQAGCGHSITHRRAGVLKCSWCGKVLEVLEELELEPAAALSE